MSAIIGLRIYRDDSDFQTACQIDAFMTRGSGSFAKTFLQTVKDSIKVRTSDQAEPPVIAEILPPEIAKLSAEHREAFLAFAHGIELEAEEKFFARVMELFDYYIWKVAKIPAETRKIFVLGCGRGFELPFIRYVAPDAEIVAVEFKQAVPQGAIDKLGITFIQADAIRYLNDNTQTFDVAFSNHVIEHFGEPEMILKLMLGALVPGGKLVSTVPLDLDSGTPYADRLRRQCSAGGDLNLLDTGYLDIGHSWKTTAQDVQMTLAEVGFGEVELLQRNFSYDNLSETFDAYSKAKASTTGLANQVLLEAPRSIAKSVFGDNVPRLVHKAFVYADINFDFGANKLKSDLAPELLIVAGKSAG
jgi:SAM-dependent methyltransferase